MMSGKTSETNWFPLELVKECRSYRTVNEDQSEELLQRVLSVLAGHNEKAEQEARHLMNVLLATRMYQTITNDGKEDTHSFASGNNNQLWLALELIRGLLCGNDDAPDDHSSCDVKSDTTIPAVMNPLDVHAVVVQAIVFLDTEQSMNEAYDTPSLDKETDLPYRNQSAFFLSTCLLLCTWSLEQLASADRPLKRWKRYHSLVLETVRLFQRNCLVMIGSYATTMDQMEHWVSLWVKYILPSSRHLWQKLPIPNALARSEWLVGVISVTSTWMEILACLFPNDFHADQLANTLFKSIEETVFHADECLGHAALDTLLWCHPWRESIPDPRFSLADPATLLASTLELSVAYWTKLYQHHSDDLPMIDTQWNSFGLALLARFAWYSDKRPWVYHPRYVWQMWFPHVANLMNFSETSSAFASDNNFQFAIWIQDQSIIFLKDLLETQPQNSLAGKVGRPLDDPVGTFQLLFNALMESSKRSNQEATTRPADIFAICKQLLSKYTPSSHLTIIQKLIETCPHQGLKPKILDLMRPLMFGKETPGFEDPIWSYLVSLVNDLERYLVQESESQESTQSSCRIQDVEDLIDQVEFFVAAIFLLELGLRRGQDSKELAGQLTHHSKMLETLRTTTAKWEELAAAATTTEDSSPPEQFFRLFLLESALARLLDLVTSILSE